MSLFRHRDDHGPWFGASARERHLAEMLAVVIAQNEAILAKLEARPSKLSPEDQAMADQIFATAAATTAKVDAALKQ